MKRFSAIVVALALWAPVLANNAQAPTQSGAATAHAYAPMLQAADQGNPNVKVWVNTASGVYHCPGTRWYGTTKRGEYMSQAQAQKKGYRPAYGKVCR